MEWIYGHETLSSLYSIARIGFVDWNWKEMEWKESTPTIIRMTIKQNGWRDERQTPSREREKDGENEYFKYETCYFLPLQILLLVLQSIFNSFIDYSSINGPFFLQFTVQKCFSYRFWEGNLLEKWNEPRKEGICLLFFFASYEVETSTMSLICDANC